MLVRADKHAERLSVLALLLIDAEHLRRDVAWAKHLLILKVDLDAVDGVNIKVRLVKSEVEDEVASFADH